MMLILVWDIQVVDSSADCMVRQIQTIQTNSFLPSFSNFQISKQCVCNPHVQEKMHEKQSIHIFLKSFQWEESVLLITPRRADVSLD